MVLILEVPALQTASPCPAHSEDRGQPGVALGTELGMITVQRFHDPHHSMDVDHQPENKTGS